MELDKDHEDILIENIEELERLEYTEDKKFPIFKTVNVIKKDFLLYELYRKYCKGKVIYEVDFQRKELWEAKQKCELIERILMGLPLPIFYFKKHFAPCFLMCEEYFDRVFYTKWNNIELCDKVVLWGKIRL